LRSEKAAVSLSLGNDVSQPTWLRLACNDDSTVHAQLCCSTSNCWKLNYFLYCVTIK